MRKPHADEEFKKECVKLRLSGVAVKTICEGRKIWPPQLNKWMKEYADLDEFKKLRIALERTKKPHSRVDRLAGFETMPIPRKPDGKIDWDKLRRRRCVEGFHIHEFSLHFSTPEAKELNEETGVPSPDSTHVDSV